APCTDRRGRQQSAWLSARCVYGYGHGRSGGQAAEQWPTEKLECNDDGNDDAGARTATGTLRSGDKGYSRRVCGACAASDAKTCACASRRELAMSARRKYFRAMLAGLLTTMGTCAAFSQTA